MIDLRFKALPTCIESGGKAYELETDFRVWIEFERMLREEGRAWFGIFKGERPEGDDWVQAAIEFLESKNATPRHVSGMTADARAIDYVLDGDYIVAAFQQSYGIDLTEPGFIMHWHRFCALMAGLPDETRLARIIEYRTWRKPPKGEDPDEQYRRLREAWRLPEPDEDEERDKLLQWAEEFFGD